METVDRHQLAQMKYQVNTFYTSSSRRVVRPVIPVPSLAHIVAGSQNQSGVRHRRGNKRVPMTMRWVKLVRSGKGNAVAVDETEQPLVTCCGGIWGQSKQQARMHEEEEEALEEDVLAEEEEDENEVEEKSGLYSSDEEGNDTVTNVFTYGIDKRFNIL